MDDQTGWPTPAYGPPAFWETSTPRQGMGDNGPGVGDALDGAPPEAGAVQAEGRGQDAGPHVVLAAQSNCNVENRLSLLCIEGSSSATDLSQFVCQLQIWRRSRAGRRAAGRTVRWRLSYRECNSKRRTRRSVIFDIFPCSALRYGLSSSLRL